MNIKKTFLAISIAIFMVFSLSLTTTDSFAYWTSSVTGNNSSTSLTVTTGTWIQAFPWDSGTSYKRDDYVTNNGYTYRSRVNNPFLEPGVSFFWFFQWQRVS